MIKFKVGKSYYDSNNDNNIYRCQSLDGSKIYFSYKQNTLIWEGYRKPTFGGAMETVYNEVLNVRLFAKNIIKEKNMSTMKTIVFEKKSKCPKCCNCKHFEAKDNCIGDDEIYYEDVSLEDYFIVSTDSDGDKFTIRADNNTNDCYVSYVTFGNSIGVNQGALACMFNNYSKETLYAFHKEKDINVYRQWLGEK